VFSCWPGLQVVDKPNMKPTLVFLDASGEPQLTTQYAPSSFLNRCWWS
jgi:hypothetical protein